MQRAQKIFAVLVCALLACVVMSGCGKPTQSDIDAFVGTWELAERSVEGNEADTQTISFLEGYDLNVFLVLDENGTGSLEIFGETKKLTWLAGRRSKGTLTIEGDNVDMVVDDDTLTLKGDGQSLTFEKVEAAKRVTLGEGADAAESSD